MKDIINGLIERFRRQHVQARRYVAMMLVLALLTTLFVNWQLHGVGISMTADYHCGYEEHQHTAACYEKVLTCGYEEGEPETPVTSSDSSADLVSAYSAEEPEELEEPVQTEPETIWVPHEHTDACYEEHRVLTCYQEEHEHTDDCFDEYGALICGEFEHIHDDSCYTTEYELVCGLDEGELVEEPNPAYQEMPAIRPVVDLPPEPAETTPDEPVLHHHTDACYTEELVCTIPEHHHTVECLADTQADVETAEEWQAAANVALNGNWAEDLLTVAKSQLDYQQSDKNFKLDVEDQQVLRGYSRYGAWYGNPYGAWDVMFLSYCLHFAGVPQTVVPQRAGVMALHSDLRGSQWLTDADGSTARPGDIVIYNTLTTEQVAVDESSYGIALLDLDEDPDTAAQLTASEPQVDTRTVTTETVGVVSAVDPDAGTLTVISGNVDGKVAEVPAAMSDVTSVISVTGAYAAETTAVAPEDPAGSQEELDGSYALLEDEEGFGATVEWVGEARQLDPNAPALLAETADTGVKLDPSWITKTEFEKKVGNSWVPLVGNEVESGTEVQVNMSYTLPKGTLTPDRRTLCYQLPEVMKPKQATSGKILDKTDNDKVIGTYTIDTNGVAKLTFDVSEKFTGLDANGNREFTGTFQFSQKLWADDFANDKTITFENGFTLTIKAKKADIKISKGYTSYWSAFENHPENGTFINHYKVTVETTSGTKDPVTLTDTLNTNKYGNSADDYLKGGTYLTNSFKLCKVNASGKETEMSFPEYTIRKDSNGNPQVVLAALDPLEIGEKYIWYYDVQRNYADFDKMPDGVGTIYNTATAQAGDKEEKADAYYTCKTPRIEKKGEYDPKTGRIRWTITVKAPHSFLGSYMLNGSKITDSLPDGVKIVGDVKVGNTTIPAEKFRKDGYTIPADPKDFTGTELTITFETTTPLGGGSVTNTAQILTKSGHTFTASDTKNIGQGDWTLSKELASSSKGLAKWDISAANAAGESSFTLVENFQDAVNEIGQTQANTHYAYAAELEQALETGLTLTLHNGDTMPYAQAKADRVVTVTYYSGANGTGGTVTATDPSTRVQSFTIQVNKADDNPVRRVDVTGIPTHQDRSKVPTGENWTYKNSVSIQGTSKSATAEDTYRSYKSFEKRVAAESDKDESNYQGGDQTYQYSKLSGKNLHYQLVVQTAAEDDADIVITDTLPENTTFNENSVKVGMDEGTPDKIGNLKGATATVAYEKATRQLTITIEDYNLSKNARHKFRILYDVNIEEDPAWQNPSVGQVIYTNTAQWGELTETLHTTVERTVDPLKKTGKLVEGKTDRIEYQVVVNPARKDLSVGATKAPTIELWDDVTAQNGAIVRGDPESVKLYYFQYDEATNAVTRGKEVDRRLYRVLPADKDGWLHMEIPNQTAMILVYQCDVKQGSAAADYNVDNTVKLGNGDSTQSDSIKFTYASAATASTGQFLLHKVDDYSGVALPGAEFTIWQYNPQTGAWQLWSGGEKGVVTTDEKGQVSLTVLENGGDQTLKPDLLYKIVETKAPQNYQKDATPHYVLFHKSSETPEAAFATATNNGAATDDGKTILFADVQVGSAARTTTAQYTNRYSNLTVSKLWLDQDTNQPTDPAVDNIEIQVWRYTDNVESKEPFEKATLNEKNNWTATWSGEELLLTDPASGKAYHYLVEEVTTGNWNVYIDNNGVQTGNITIQNRVYTGYELPSTGGMGTAPFGVLGGALAAAAALLLVRKRKQNEEE